MQLIYILITILIFGLLVIVHEFGHFIAAKLSGIQVDEFSIGMGPPVYQKKGKETLFSIRLIPLGGYCMFQEEEEVKEVELLDQTMYIKEKKKLDPERSFYNKPAWVRFIVLIAGVTMNFLLGFLIIYLMFIFTGLNIIEAFSRSITVFLNIFGLIFISIRMLFTGEASLNDLTGPVGIVQIVGEYYKYGLLYLSLFTAMLSINLGIVNLIPIPALDGGQIVMLAYSKLTGKEMSDKIKGLLIGVSYIFLIGLTVFVAYNDVLRMVSSNG